MTINERIKTIQEELYDNSTNRFAEAIGVKPSVISGYTGKRQSKPSYDVLESIVANANVSPRWLLTGEGTMHESIPEIVAGTYLEDQEEYDKAVEMGLSLIPEYTDAFRGGNIGAMISTDSVKAYWAFPNVKADIVVEVEGDSMANTYPAGSKVAVREIQFDREYPTVGIPFGEVFGIIIDNGDENYLTFLKRLRRHPDKALQYKYWIAQSDNIAYDDFEIEISKVRYLFIVVAGVKLTGF